MQTMSAMQVSNIAHTAKGTTVPAKLLTSQRCGPGYAEGARQNPFPVTGR